MVVDFSVGQHQWAEGAGIIRADLIVAKTGLAQIRAELCFGFGVHGLQRAAHRHPGAVPAVAAVRIIDHALGVRHNGVCVRQFALRQFDTDVNRRAGRIDGHDVPARGRLGVAAYQCVKVSFQVLPLQGADVVVRQRVNAGRPLRQHKRRRPEQHADGRRNRQQSDGKAALYGKRFLFVRVRHSFLLLRFASGWVYCSRTGRGSQRGAAAQNIFPFYIGRCAFPACNPCIILLEL